MFNKKSLAHVKELFLDHYNVMSKHNQYYNAEIKNIARALNIHLDFSMSGRKLTNARRF